jgi:hypothetical protein
MRTAFRFFSTTLGVLASALGSAFAFAPEDLRLEFPLEWETHLLVAPPHWTEASERAADPSRSPWLVQQDPRTGLVHMAHGGDAMAAGAISTAENAATAAREFLLARADLAGARADNLQFLAARHARGKWVAHFGQTLGSVPVWRAKAFVLMGESGRVVAFGSDFFPELEEAPRLPSLSSSEAIQSASAALGATPLAGGPLSSEPYYVPVRRGEDFVLVPAFRVVFEVEEPFGTWETFVDGETGAILSRRNLYHTVNVVGTVEADVQNQPPTYGWCDGSAIEPMEHLTVNVEGGGSAGTDSEGAFVIPHGGFGAVTLTAELKGPFSDIDRFTGLGADAALSVFAIPGIPEAITWDASNSRQDERTTFFHANRVHDFMTTLDPTFTQLDYSMRSIVGRTDGFCPGNAWWNGSSMNFCEESVPANRANTGELGDVIYHEFGHGVTQEVYERNSAPEPPSDLHEGNSDILANFLDRNSQVGLGFFLSTCATGIRDADNDKIYPDDLVGEGHADGEIIAAFYWDAWQSMLADLPQSEADQAAFETWHLARDMGLPYTQPDQVLWTFLMDDDDEYLNNGTPHHAHFCTAAQNHGFDCPAIVPLLVEHEELPHTSDGSGGFTVQATVIPFFGGTVDPASVQVSYRVDGGPFTDVAMNPVGPDTFEGTIPGIDLGEVEYFISASNTGDSTATSPIGAPATLHAFDVALIYEDFESGALDWVVAGSVDSGEWELVDPIGTSAQPEDDATPGSGTMCWVTGQCAGPNCPNGCTEDCNDVDNGVTRLLSPVFQLAGATGVVVKYDRWFSGDDQDPWKVAISNDGGTSWTNVEVATAPSLEWTDHRIDVDALFGAAGQVRVRFVASDHVLSGSLVEAGVDELRILATGGSTSAPPSSSGTPFVFSLEQNQPNPFRPDTEIAYSLPAPGEVDLTVYDVGGRAVRRILGGTQPGGRHTVRWDGRDASGQRVAAGVYFYRMVSGDFVATRKMTVTK